MSVPNVTGGGAGRFLFRTVPCKQTHTNGRHDEGRDEKQMSVRAEWSASNSNVQQLLK